MEDDDLSSNLVPLDDDPDVALARVDPELVEDALAYANAARSERTRDAYRYQWAGDKQQ